MQRGCTLSSVNLPHMWKQASTWLLFMLMVWSSSGQVVYAHFCRTKNSLQIGLGPNHSSTCARQKLTAPCCAKIQPNNQDTLSTKTCAPENSELPCCSYHAPDSKTFEKSRPSEDPILKKHCCDQKSNWWRPGLELPKPIKEVKLWFALGFLGLSSSDFESLIGKNHPASTKPCSKTKAEPYSAPQFLSLLQVYRI